jgi:hypothetical protein
MKYGILEYWNIGVMGGWGKGGRVELEWNNGMME